MLPSPLPVAVALVLLLTTLVPVSCEGTSWELTPDNNPRQSPLNLELPEVVLSEAWDVLGPFRLGTRGQWTKSEDRVG